MRNVCWSRLGWVWAVVALIVGPTALAADGLVGHWKLDEGAGLVAADRSPSGADAAVHGAQWVTDTAGRRLEFYGSGEYLVTADPAKVQLRGAFTIGFWLNPADWAGSPSQGIVSKKKSDRDPGYVVYNNGDTPTKISIRVAGTRSGRDITSAGDVTSGVWQHWAVTCDPATGTAAWYRDGRLDVARQVEPFGDLSSGVPLEIGHSQTWGGYYGGSLAEVRIYARALTAEEVAADSRAVPAPAAAAARGTAASTGLPAAPRWRVVTPLSPTTEEIVAGCTVQEFGAKGDGVTDDTAAFQAAMDMMGASGGGAVFAPAGRYAMRGNLRVPTGVTLRGDWARPGDGVPVRGTVLMAYAGRGSARGWPFLSLRQCSGVKGLSIWYPEQDAAAIVPYPFCLQQAGWESMAVEDVTLVNPYQGIAIGPRGNELHYLRGIHGSPLALGLQIDFVTDTGRSGGVRFDPDVWSDSGLPGAPPRGGPHAAWMRANGTGIRIFRYDWIYSAFVQVRGYRTGLEILASPSGAANGQLYGYRITDCTTAVSVVEALTIGLSFSACTLAGSEAAVATRDSFDSTLLFHTCDLRSATRAADLRGSTESCVLFQQCTFDGEVVREAGNLSLLGCRWTSPGNHVTLGEAVVAATVAGCTFAGAPGIVDRSQSERVRVLPDSVPGLLPLPVYPPPVEKDCRPAKADLYVVTDPAWGAVRDGATDDTTALRKALDAAGRAGGGIVFLPGGEYAVRGNLTVPPGVELRGVYDVPHHTLGKGSTLRVYAGRNDEAAAPFLVLAAHSGLHGLTFLYPEQALEAIIPYPFLVQGRGEGIYVVDISAVNAYRFLDFMTHRCDRHYLDYPAGVALRTGVAIGGGSRDGELRNTQLQTHYWNRSPYPVSPGVVHGPGASRVNRVWEYQYDNLEAFVFGDCHNERQYQNCVFGACRGLVFTGQNGTGATGTLVLGHGTDGARVPAAFDGIGAGGVDLVNSQLVSMNSSDPDRPPVGRRYLDCGPELRGEVRLFNSTFWGQPQHSAVVANGTLRLELARLNEYATFAVGTGGALALTSTCLGTNTGGGPELEVAAGARATLTANLTPYGMRTNPDAAATAVHTHAENQRNLPMPADARAVSVELGRIQKRRGLALRAKDGESENAPVTRGGRAAWTSVRPAPWGADAYVMYWQVEFPGFRHGQAPHLELTVECFDEAAGELLVYYDSSDASHKSIPQHPGAWKVATTFRLTGDGTWKTLECPLPDARFDGRCNGGDLRFDIRTAGPPPAVAAVRLERLE